MEKSVKLNRFYDVLKMMLQENKTSLKQSFILHVIGTSWKKIVGDLSQHCSPQKISGSKLIINVDNSVLANQLFIIRKDLLKRINMFLCGKYMFLDLVFINSSQIRMYTENIKLEKEKGENVFRDKCPMCGVNKDNNLKLCYTCMQKMRKDVENELTKRICNAPWLKYDDVKSKEIDLMIYKFARENLEDYFYNRVLDRNCSEEDKVLAVLFYTGKKPEEISQEEYKKTLAVLIKDGKIKE